MKKNVFLIIITLITVLCIIVGSTHHLGISRKGYNSLSSSIRRGLSRSGLHFHFGDNDDDDFDDDEIRDFDFDDDDPKSFDTETISEFKELDVNLKVGGITIERGNKWELRSKYSYDYLKPVYTLKNGKLSISQPGYKNQKLGTKTCRIVVTVPFGTELDKLNMNMDVGAVELSGFDIKKGSIDTDVGAIEISNVNFNDLDLDSDVGAVSIELVEPIENYDISINSDLGGIVVDGRNVKRRYSQKGDKDKRLRINTDVGGVEVK